MKKIKYGIIGAGTMAREHILNISLIDNAEVVALADPCLLYTSPSPRY